MVAIVTIVIYISKLSQKKRAFGKPEHPYETQ